jgi:3-hydroxy acid dehydrogenase/malonic semialdehyde reductase
MDLKNETIFITGASSGFGEACVRKLASTDAKIIITARRKDRLEKLRDELESDNIYPLALDVSNKEEVYAKVACLPDEFKNITALINNAGLALGLSAAHECSMDDWETMVKTNINGVLYCTHAILPGMVSRNKGYIINIGSIAGNYFYPGANVYGGTKAFVRQFSHNLRADLLGKNIRVTNIEPGIAETEFSIVRFKDDQEKAKKVYAGTIPLLAEDIAETIYWCLTRPPHVNINSLEIMPTCQAYGALPVFKN